LRDGAERDVGSGAREYRQIAQVGDRIPKLAWISHADRKALQTFDGLADSLSTDRRAHDALHVRDCHSIAAHGIAIDIDLDVSASGKSFGQCRTYTWHMLHRPLDRCGDLVDDRGISPRHFD